MHPTRTGKIARLPREIREALNRRLQNGEPGGQLVAWLNAAPEVRQILDLYFSGHAITEQNLSDWRSGGYEDWLRFQDTRDWIRNLVDRSSDLAEETDPICVSDWLSAPLAVALGKCIQRVATEAPTNLEQQKHLLALSRELAQLRRGDHKHNLLRIQKERLDILRTLSVIRLPGVPRPSKTKDPD
jgi:hypothetical protein